MVSNVICWGLGAVGQAAVSGVLGHPDLNLVGAAVYSAEKDGRDVGDICGIAPTGVTATTDRKSLISTDADAVVFSPGRSWVTGERRQGDLDDLLALLRSGKNVVNLWWPSLVNPAAQDPHVHEQLTEACIVGSSSFVTVGMDPGYGTASLALSALQLSREVETVRMIQFMDNSKWEGDGIDLFYGFGKDDPAESHMAQPGVTTSMHLTTLHLLADAIGVTLDDIVEEHDVIRADEPIDCAFGHVATGTVSGMHYRVIGRVGGRPRVTVEHVERLRDKDFPELAFSGDGYRVLVHGTPETKLDMTFSAPEGWEGDLIAVPCAMTVVNAIPVVVEAAPGVLTVRDLKPYPSKNVPA
jgi:2,4-diaminopentanoate dehydrogenase